MASLLNGVEGVELGENVIGEKLNKGLVLGSSGKCVVELIVLLRELCCWGKCVVEGNVSLGEVCFWGNVMGEKKWEHLDQEGTDCKRC